MDLVNEIQKIQIDKKKNQIFEDFEELFETAERTECFKNFDFINEKKIKDKEILKNKKKMTIKEKLKTLPSFTGLSVIQPDSKQDNFKFSRRKNYK